MSERQFTQAIISRVASVLSLCVNVSTWTPDSFIAREQLDLGCVVARRSLHSYPQTAQFLNQGSVTERTIAQVACSMHCRDETRTALREPHGISLAEQLFKFYKNNRGFNRRLISPITIGLHVLVCAGRRPTFKNVLTTRDSHITMRLQLYNRRVEWSAVNLLCLNRSNFGVDVFTLF